MEQMRSISIWLTHFCNSPVVVWGHSGMLKGAQNQKTLIYRKSALPTNQQVPHHLKPFHCELQAPLTSFSLCLPHLASFSLPSLSLYILVALTHMHAHWQKKHHYSLCPSAGCWGFTGMLSVFICAIFWGRSVSEVLWEVIQKLPSQGRRGEREAEERDGKILFIPPPPPSSLSLSDSFQAPGEATSHAWTKRIFTVLNNAASPQFLHLCFLFLFFSGHLKRQIHSCTLAVSNKGGTLPQIHLCFVPVYYKLELDIQPTSRLWMCLHFLNIWGHFARKILLCSDSDALCGPVWFGGLSRRSGWLIWARSSKKYVSDEWIASKRQAKE